MSKDDLPNEIVDLLEQLAEAMTEYELERIKTKVTTSEGVEFTVIVK